MTHVHSILFARCRRALTRPTLVLVQSFLINASIDFARSRGCLLSLVCFCHCSNRVCGVESPLPSIVCIFIIDVTCQNSSIFHCALLCYDRAGKNMFAWSVVLPRNSFAFIHTCARATPRASGLPEFDDARRFRIASRELSACRVGLGHSEGQARMCRKLRNR